MKRISTKVKGAIDRKINCAFLSILIWLLDKYLKNNSNIGSGGWDSVEQVGHKSLLNSISHLRYKREMLRRNK